MTMSFIQEAIADDNLIESKDETIRNLSIQISQLKKSIDEVPQDCLSIEQCAKAIGVSKPTWYKMRSQGVTPDTFSIPGVNRQLVLKAVFDKWLKDLSKQQVNHDFGSNRIKFNQ